jgi:hypothetical protein
LSFSSELADASLLDLLVHEVHPVTGSTHDRRLDALEAAALLVELTDRREPTVEHHPSVS